MLDSSSICSKDSALQCFFVIFSKHSFYSVHSLPKIILYMYEHNQRCVHVHVHVAPSCIVIEVIIPFYSCRPFLKVSLLSFFIRHFERMLKEYGPTLCLDLLGNRDMEPLLTEAFTGHLDELSISGAAQYVHFDYHLHCRPGHTEALESILLPECQDFLDSCGFYLEVGGVLQKAQAGVLRHNCLDCLDRSNNAQSLMGIMVS